MDAIKFIRERNRMCRYYFNIASYTCSDCPAKDVTCSNINGMEEDDNIVPIVEKWSKEHPPETRQSRFLKQWPETKLDANDVVSICPAVLDKKYRDEYGGCDSIDADCRDCRREFWSQEVEE